MIAGVLERARTVRPARAAWLVVLLFASLTILLAYPLTLHPVALRFPTGPDGDLGWYLLGWDTHAFLHRPWAIFDANIYYPQRYTLAYGENIIGIALFAAPIIWLTGHLLLAANFVCMLSATLCGVAVYLLARRIGLSVGPAIIAGIVFQCAPPQFFRIGQMPLASIQWIPLALAALHGYVERGLKRDLRLACACVTMQALSSGHGAVFMAVVLLTFIVYRLVLGEPIQLVRRIRDLGLTGALLLVPAFLVFLPYRAVQHDVGMKRGLGTWDPNYTAFIASPSHVHRFVLSLLTNTDVNATANAFLFPGYLALALAAAAVVGVRPGSDPFGGARARDDSFRGFRPKSGDLLADGVRSGSDPRVVSPGVPRVVWPGVTFALELALIVAAAAGAVLTAGTLIHLRAGTAQLFDPPGAIRVWSTCLLIVAAAAVLGRRIPADTIVRHRRPLRLLLSIASVWTLLAIVRPALHAGDGMIAEYFRNTTWSGAPAFSAIDSEPSTGTMLQRWPGGPPETFSVRWTGFVTVNRSGLYTFATTSDDGSELVVDNRSIVENGGPHGLTTRSGNIQLDRGSHLVVLRFNQYGGAAAVGWSWSRDGARLSPIPSWLLSQHRTRYANAVAARVVDWGLAIFAVLTTFAAIGYLRAATRRRGHEVAIWAQARRQDATSFYAVLTIVGVGLALGPPYGLWRYVYWLPGFNLIRVSSRFAAIALLGLAIVAAIGFAKLTSGMSARRRAIATFVVAALMVAEYAAMPIGVQPSNFEIPAIDRWLDREPKPFVVAEVPVEVFGSGESFERQETAYMIHSTAHWQKTVHGYSGWRTDFHRELYAKMETFPDERSVTALSDLGVTYVVVHSDLYTPEEWCRVEERIRQFPARLRLEHAEGAGRVYRIMVSRESVVGSRESGVESR
jgi:hypothetical protein